MLHFPKSIVFQRSFFSFQRQICFFVNISGVLGQTQYSYCKIPESILKYELILLIIGATRNDSPLEGLIQISCSQIMYFRGNTSSSVNQGPRTLVCDVRVKPSISVVIPRCPSSQKVLQILYNGNYSFKFLGVQIHIFYMVNILITNNLCQKYLKTES